MSDYKELLGVLSVLCALIAYILYLRDIFLHHTKPHAFSWLIWALLAGVAFAAQYTGNAGAGSWVTFTDVFLCTLIFVIALWIGEKSYVLLDWISLFAGLLSLVLWWFTKTPTLSVILITVVDYCGFFPTFRKSYSKPWEESASLFFLSGLKYTAAFFALSAYSLSTALYIGALIPINVILAVMILLRRNLVQKQ
ncbi:MAG: hypothetical protein WC840_03005 [Candidatus Peribacteraceae bacterium]